MYAYTKGGATSVFFASVCVAFADTYDANMSLCTAITNRGVLATPQKDNRKEGNIEYVLKHDGLRNNEGENRFREVFVGNRSKPFLRGPIIPTDQPELNVLLPFVISFPF